MKLVTLTSFLLVFLVSCGSKKFGDTNIQTRQTNKNTDHYSQDGAYGNYSQSQDYYPDISNQPMNPGQQQQINSSATTTPPTQPRPQQPQQPSTGLCNIPAIGASSYPNGRYQVAKRNFGSGYIVYYPSQIEQLTRNGACKLPVIGWANGMTVGQGGAWGSDLVYGKTIKVVASHGYIVVAAQIEGMQGKDGSQVASGVESVIARSEFSRYASSSRVGNMGHSMGGGATLYAGAKLTRSGRKVALCPIQGAPGPSTSSAPTLYLSGTGDSMDSGWGSHRNSGGIKMFSQILGATHMSWYFNADSNHYGGACAMWFDCHLKRQSTACQLASGSYFTSQSGKWQSPQKNF